MARPRLLAASLALAALALVPLAHAVPGRIVIKNLDSAGEGFNSPTAAAPVGGNPGTTVGQQRLNVFQYAADIWGAILQNPDTIYVNARFDSQTCTVSSAVLGSAGPTFVDRDDPAYPFAATWYHIALAEKLAGGRIVTGAQGEINATFNSELDGDPACLGGTMWYYGFDGLEGTKIELLPVVLHELGHGLGFSTTTSGATGNFINDGSGPKPHVWDHFLYDSLTGRTWAHPSESNTNRVTSAISGDKLSWSGAAGRYGVTHRPLNRRARILASPSVAGLDSVNAANFGAPLTLGGVTANLVLVTDGSGAANDGCSGLTNGAAVNGNVALVDRGTCNFTTKAQTAQAAGAVAVVIANNQAGALAPTGTDPGITIPVVAVSFHEGVALKNAISGGPVSVTVGFDPVLYAGADGSQRPLMYAPNPYQQGSSVSHFDVSTSPNALMEPAINTDLSSDVDLAKHVFVDIGWLPMSTPVALANFTAEDLEAGVLLRWRFADASDVATLTLQRAPAEEGPWTPLEAEFFTRDGMTAALDTAAEPGRTHFYRLHVVETGGRESTWGLVSAYHAGAGAGPAVLRAPSPNPTRTGTTFAFRLPRPEFVRLEVVDASGRRLRTLREGMTAAGEHQLFWDGTAAGREVPAGLYFAVLRTSQGRLAQRIAIIR